LSKEERIQDLKDYIILLPYKTEKIKKLDELSKLAPESIKAIKEVRQYAVDDQEFQDYCDKILNELGQWYPNS
jgi:hypothetical protein